MRKKLPKTEAVLNILYTTLRFDFKNLFQVCKLLVYEKIQYLYLTIYTLLTSLMPVKNSVYGLESDFLRSSGIPFVLLNETGMWGAKNSMNRTMMYNLIQEMVWDTLLPHGPVYDQYILRDVLWPAAKHLMVRINSRHPLPFDDGQSTFSQATSLPWGKTTECGNCSRRYTLTREDGIEYVREG